MTKIEETVLVREVGKLAGFVGGFGARFAARRLPIEESVTYIAVATTKADVQASLREILKSIGRQTDEFAAETPEDSISAIVGSGQLNMNPTIVHVQVVESSAVTTRLFIRALAKEGLVNQQSAHRAIERIKVLLSSRHGELLGGDSLVTRD
jgi:hypothetical protein